MSTIDAQKVYIAFFNRPADAAGLAYWKGRVDAGVPLLEIAKSFVDSPEYKALYGGSTPEAVIGSIYQNLFGRTPEADGLNFWADALLSGKINAGYLAYEVLMRAASTDHTIIANKAIAADIYTATLPKDPAAYDKIAIAEARSWLSTIDEAPVDRAAIKEQAIDLLGARAITEDKPIDTGPGDTGFVDDGLPPPISSTYSLMADRSIDIPALMAQHPAPPADVILLVEAFAPVPPAPAFTFDDSHEATALVGVSDIDSFSHAA